MSKSQPPAPSASRIKAALFKFIDHAVTNTGSSTAIKPGHRIPFHWPPNAISHKYHVLASDWTDHAQYDSHGETFTARVAHTEHGYFGRCETLWHEARGNTLAEMLKELAKGAEPLLKRQHAIASTLGARNRYVGYIRDLALEDLVKLLYCEDRDVANSARVEIEKHASLHVFGPSLIEVIKDERHPYRRSAQWCVLDIFEDLPSVCRTTEEQIEAIDAMKMLIWNAQDDYARTIYKAGVVVGGHLPDERGGPILLECLNSPNKIGRRSAIHGLFHVVEWNPSMMDEVVTRLKKTAETDSDPILREYASHMARDIAEGKEHVSDPDFPEELL